MSDYDEDDDLVGTGSGRRVSKKHNNPPSNVGGIAAGQLRSFVERIESLEEEKRGLQEDIKEVYAEAKGSGFDTKQIRTLIRLRKQDKAKRQEERTILELYAEALGMEI